MPIRGSNVTERHTSDSPRTQACSWIANQSVDQSVFLPPNGSIPSQADQAYLVAQLQMELARQQQSVQLPSDFYSTSSSFTSNPSGVSSMDRSQVTSLDFPNAVAATMDPKGYSSMSSVGAPSLPPGVWLASNMQDPYEMQQYLQAGNAYQQSRATQLESQVLAIERMRRDLSTLQNDLTRTQNELSRAEREIARQKSLRETERSEFGEAKERLKHSWANDREDFARVKTTLKTKNAEHHAQSGRLSQQLKDCEACNRALRDCLVRNNIPFPLELESSSSKRLFTLLTRTDKVQDTADSACPNLDPLQHTASTQNLHESFYTESQAEDEKSPFRGLPDRFGSHLALSSHASVVSQEPDLEVQSTQGLNGI